MIESRVLNVVEEQIAVQFTGKVNILSTFNRQFLGHILFKNGDVIHVTFDGSKGLKAFYSLIIQEFTLKSFDYVVEPELVEDKDRQIHYPFSVIKNKIGDVLKKYRESLKLRPPEKVKILIDAEFIEDTLPVTPEEFDVLKTLSDFNNPSEIYEHCELLEHEVTMALVSLRKKGALKILAPKV
jgi:hypothetical protein